MPVFMAGDPPPEQFIQDDIVIGLREDGFVVWRPKTQREVEAI